MPYICLHPENYMTGKPIGSGQCVAFVRACTSAPPSSQWTEGVKVRGNPSIAFGTAIATFENGKYPNHKTGNHAAIFDSQDEKGIWVYDQWAAQGFVAKRYIRFKGGVGSRSNDGDSYSVIE